VKTILKVLEGAGILHPKTSGREEIQLESVRTTLVKACQLWSDELRQTYIGNEFARGQLSRTTLLGWLLEMYHYIKDFPYAIEHGANRAEGRLRRVLVKYANEERGHEEFVLQTLLRLGLSREEVETSAPLLATRAVGFLMRELFEVEPSSALLVAALLEAQEFDEEQIQLFQRKLQEYYAIPAESLVPYFKHQQIDVGLGHAELLASNLDLIQVTEIEKLDALVNKLHDLKHAFDLQGLEIKSYYNSLDGKYFPRQPMTFSSL
jgi:pyrroloquinoline quinone (PQQ) biosynthesis protein C